MRCYTSLESVNRSVPGFAVLPLGYRDHCSTLLVPLNKCRRTNNYAPWECEHERHAYEKCQYDDYIRRMKALSKQKLQALSGEES
ncbi:NADH-ubiquinone oxidoreductase B18 subunit-domain-containing protein [Cantharellus anzutake]|uniref:NADH-ubiquinone oxidoreductase B18 subunit-domain-containing protein n=1 Tax=Cantharellus anzutake TaxID=1750568 RepID=UPI0019086E3D|nr:NADH-ubiquinone oxidoreductase B18 subunit-domain-containing protein [Cantharellus anzutake]KAF8334995.1 NADH-ubiquinone oxidoreductase B18 subunit-domain-containing protein [Cantharellus anzutake]